MYRLMHRCYFNRCYWIISAILVPVMSLAAQAPGGPSAMPVEAVPVHMENLVIEINAVGTLLANETVTIRPEDHQAVFDVICGKTASKLSFTSYNFSLSLAMRS